MERYIESGGAAAAPAGVAAGSTSNYPTKGDSGTGVQASVMGEWWYYMMTEEMRQVVTDAGIAPSQTALNQLSAAIQALIKAAPSSLQPGDIIICPNGSPRSGTLELNGALISRVTYADLWAFANGSSNITDDATQQASQWGSFSTGDLATTFRLPDLRGEFIRGYDNGRGVDSGRVLGTSQLDQMQGHVHTTPLWGGISPGAASFSSGGSAAFSSGTYGAANDGYNGTPRTGAETRPRNLPFMFCIKY